MDCKCLECDCNVIHDAVVNNTLKAMPSNRVIEKIAVLIAGFYKMADNHEQNQESFVIVK